MSQENNDTYRAKVEKEQCKSEAVLLGLIAVSPTNPRKHFPAEEQAELVESIKQLGVLQPVLLRMWPANYPWSGDLMPMYELVAGERRYRAALEAGRTFIPGLIRDLTDQEVLEMQIVENLQRKGLHPLEEAEGYGRMMRDHGYNADQLGEKVSKSRAYIYAKLKLLDLCEDAKRIYQAGGIVESVALLLARIPSKALQLKALNDVTTRQWNDEIMSARQAQRHIKDRYMLQLDRAPFPCADTNLAGKLDCQSCPQRTGANPELFADVESADVCTNPDCFAEKKAAFIQRQADEARAQGKEVITGKEAKAITFATHKSLDDVCYDDEQDRTYRELLGDLKETVLVENTMNGTLVEKVPVEVLQTRLKAVGIDFNAPRQSHDFEKEREEKKQAVAAVREKRQAAYELIRSAIKRGMTINSLSGSTLAVIVKKLLDNCEYSERELLTQAHGVVGQSDHDRWQALLDGVELMSANNLCLLLIDMATASELDVGFYDNLDEQPELITALTKTLVEPKKTPKSSKPGELKASGPTKAAQARGKGALNDALAKTSFKSKPKTKKASIQPSAKAAGTKQPAAAETSAERCTKTLELPLPDQGETQ